MTENTGFAAFALYNALKLHFTSESYDFFKYQGKTNVSKDTFAKNKAKYSFYKLSRKYSLEELKGFYISNFITHSVAWIGEITNEDGESTYRKWQKIQQSLTYMFERDMIYLFERYKPDELFKVKSGYPHLLQELMQESISIETVVILNDMFNFLPKWNEKIQDDIIWPNWEMKIRKYTPFLNYSKDKIKVIIKQTMKDYAKA